MITATRLTRILGILGVVGFLAHATSSLATSGAYQDPIASPASAAAVEAAPPPKEPEPIKDLPAVPDEPGLDLADLPAAPAAKAELPADVKEEAPLAVPAPPPAEEPNPLPPARDLTSGPVPAVPPAAAGPEADRPAPRPARVAPKREPVEPTDDPDAHARTFVERNRREADEQLKTLRDEAAQLKGRLARVEAGIRRWEALSDALARSDQEKAAGVIVDQPRIVRSRTVEVGVPIQGQGVIIQSQPLTRSNYVPVPQPR